MDENAYRYSHVDHETSELIKVLTGNRALEKYEGKENNKTENKVTKKQKGGECNMCQAFEDYRMDGVREGEAIGEAKIKISFIRKHYNKSKPSEEVADLFELDLSKVEEIYTLLDTFPDDDDTSLAKRLCNDKLLLA